MMKSSFRGALSIAGIFFVLLAPNFLPEPGRAQAAEIFLSTTNMNFLEILGNLLPEPRIVGIAPSGGAVVSPSTHVEITWNQPVDHDSFFAHVEITPDLPVESLRILNVAWDYQRAPNTIKIFFEPHFPENETITVRIAPGVKGLFTAKTSTQAFESKFQTRSETLLLFEQLQKLLTIFGRNF